MATVGERNTEGETVKETKALEEWAVHSRRVQIVGQIPYVLDMKCIDKVLGETTAADSCILDLSELDKVIEGDEDYEDVQLDVESRKEAKEKWDTLRVKLELGKELYDTIEYLKYGHWPSNYSTFNLQEAQEAVNLVQINQWKRCRYLQFIEMIKKLDEMSDDL